METINPEIEAAMTPEQALKPCPFCGSTELSAYGTPYGCWQIYYVRCDDCGTRGGGSIAIKDDSDEARKQATVAWNTRKGSAAEEGARLERQQILEMVKQLPQPVVSGGADSTDFYSRDGMLENLIKAIEARGQK